jgi:hypothetical protein
MRVTARLVAAVLSCLLCSLTAYGQESVPTPPGIQVPAPDPSSPFLGGVPTGEISATPVALSLRNAIARGLQHNLGILLQEQALTTARASRWESLTGLLPDSPIFRDSRAGRSVHSTCSTPASTSPSRSWI